MNRYWFARRFEDAATTRVTPVSGEGWGMLALLVGCLVAGLAGLLLATFTYRAPFLGMTLFFGFGAVGVLAFLIAVRLKSDLKHTAEDYRAGRVRNA